MQAKRDGANGMKESLLIKPVIGERKYGREIGKRDGNHLYGWLACEDCGRERWVRLYVGKPLKNICQSCNRMGQANPRWKGGLHYSHGYVYVLRPEHPHALSKGYVNRARVVLEEKLGRPLLDGCEPHHKNEIRGDDRPENLEELTHNDHTILHNKERHGR